MQVFHNYDDMSAHEDEMTEITKKKKRLEESESEDIEADKLTSDISHVNKVLKTPTSEDTTSGNPKKTIFDTIKVVKTSTTSNIAQVDLDSLTL